MRCFFFFISTPKLSRGFLFSSLWCLGSTFTASQLNKEVIIQGTLVSDLLWVRSLRRDWANRQGSLFFNYHFGKIRIFYLLILRIYSSMNKTSWGQGQTFACFCVRTFFQSARYVITLKEQMYLMVKVEEESSEVLFVLSISINTLNKHCL